MPIKQKRKPPIGAGLSVKQMKRKKPINSDLLRDVQPLTPNQEKLFQSYDNNQNLVAYGCAGTGKTFVTLYKALLDVLDEKKKAYKCLYVEGHRTSNRESEKII